MDSEQNNQIPMNENFPEKLDDNEQLTIFLHDQNSGLSNTINLFDNIPFYSVQQPKNDEGVIVNQFTFDDKISKIKRDYKVKITKGNFVQETTKGKNKGKQTTVARYPNVTDELIVQIILKLAAEGQSFIVGGHVSVAFSKYQIFQELKDLKLSRSYHEILESIEILSSSQSDLLWTDEFGQPRSCKSSIFSNRRWISPHSAPIEYKGKKDLFCVTLHPLITKSIVEKSFRQFNYQRHMSLQDFLSRWLHKRLSHNFTWANHHLEKPFHLALSTIINNSGIKAYPSINNTIRRVEKSIDELVNKNVLDGKRTKLVRKMGGPRAKRTVDAVFNIFPTEAFSKEQTISNKRQKDIKGLNGYSGLIDTLNKN